MKDEQGQEIDGFLNKKNSDENRDRVNAKIDDIVKCQFALLLRRGYPSEKLLAMCRQITSMHEIAKTEEFLKKEAI